MAENLLFERQMQTSGSIQVLFGAGEWGGGGVLAKHAATFHSDLMALECLQ